MSLVEPDLVLLRCPESVSTASVQRDQNQSASETDDSQSTSSVDSGHVSAGSYNHHLSVENEPLIENEETLQLWKTNNLAKMDRSMSKASLTSTSSASLCRICHTEYVSSRDPFVSPCRCSGSLLYVHRSCLVHWLELSTRKFIPSPQCELCCYNYKRGACINLRSLHFPSLGYRDRLLNLLFLASSVLMFMSAAIGFHFLLMADKYQTAFRNFRSVSANLNYEDISIIVCATLFFISFFTAVFTQYRAEASVFRLMFRFLVINSNWTIRNYDIKDDPEMLAIRQARADGRVAPSLVGMKAKNGPSDQVPFPLLFSGAIV
ncbi:unnamed protein product [Auanema sp. JU1783]|nr:unnamed protein product [Auanema sp. JU1783]